MVQIRALQTDCALLALKPYETALEQIPSTLSAGRGSSVRYEHEQILALCDAGHAGILHSKRMCFQLKLVAWPYRVNIRLLVTI